MSGLMFLTPRDFVVKQNSDGQYHLTHRLNGISVVLFYSRSCKHCDALIPIFRKLPGLVQGVSFAMANVNTDNNKLIQMASVTTTKIHYTPYIVVYVNGVYFLEYRGEKTVEAIARAAWEISSKATSGQSFSSGRICTSKTSGLDGYCDGDNNWDDETCMTFEEVYSTGESKKASKEKNCLTYAECYGSSCQTARPAAPTAMQYMAVPPSPGMGVQPYSQRRH